MTTKRLGRTTSTVGLLAALIVVVVALGFFRRNVYDAYQAWKHGKLFFAEEFEGTVVNTELWNTTHALQGLRYASLRGASSGKWVDVTVDGFEGVVDSPPFGAIVVQDGEIRFESGTSKAFPYIVTGPPDKNSIFPVAGDFAVEVRMKYDVIEGYGSGITILTTSDTAPAGSNLPEGEGIVFRVWGGRSVGLSIELFDDKRLYLEGPTAYHTYRLEYVGGSYSLYVDQSLEIGPFESPRRPNAICLGNPTFAYRYLRDWSDFAVDFVRVRIPNARDGSSISDGG